MNYPKKTVSSYDFLGDFFQIFYRNENLSINRHSSACYKFSTDILLYFNESNMLFICSLFDQNVVCQLRPFE